MAARKKQKKPLAPVKPRNPFEVKKRAAKVVASKKRYSRKQLKKPGGEPT